MGHMLDLAIDYCQLLHCSLHSAYKITNPEKYSPLLYITDNLLTYVIIWSAASYSSLLNIYVPLCTFLQSLTHLSAHIHYIFVSFPHLPGMFFLDMYLLSRKNRFLFAMFSAQSLWDFSCRSWSLKDVWEFSPLSLAAVLSNLISAYPHPCVSTDCKRLIGRSLCVPPQGRGNALS